VIRADGLNDGPPGTPQGRAPDGAWQGYRPTGVRIEPEKAPAMR
jgi:hypothetical protein